jgi:hypothetical protein
LQEWYFAGYGLIYLAWPWNFEPRFAVAPLACLYLWRGARTIGLSARNKPRELGLAWFPVALVLTVFAWLWMHGSALWKRVDNSGLQDESSVFVWLSSAVLAAWMIFASDRWLRPFSAFAERFAQATRALQVTPIRISWILGWALVVVLIVTGFATQAEIGRANLNPNSPQNRPSADAAAGEWINAHSGPDGIVMARHVPIVYHFAKRKVIWFPPSSNPQLLMEGISKHKVDFVIVVHRESSYYLPPEEDCFASLLKVYPDSFGLVQEAPEYRIFRVSKVHSRTLTPVM